MESWDIFSFSLIYTFYILYTLICILFYIKTLFAACFFSPPPSLYAARYFLLLFRHCAAPCVFQTCDCHCRSRFYCLSSRTLIISSKEKKIYSSTHLRFACVFTRISKQKTPDTTPSQMTPSSIRIEKLILLNKTWKVCAQYVTIVLFIKPTFVCPVRKLH